MSVLDFLRRSSDPRVVERYRLMQYEYEQLATYNAERARGIAHTATWRERMAAEQERFDREQEAFLHGEGYVQLRDGWGKPSAAA